MMGFVGAPAAGSVSRAVARGARARGRAVDVHAGRVDDARAVAVPMAVLGRGGTRRVGVVRAVASGGMSRGEAGREVQVNVKRVASSFSRSGWTAFWLQLALSIVASGILVFALAFPVVDTRASGAGASLFAQALIAAGSVASFLSTLCTFNYTRIGARCRLQLESVQHKVTIKAASIRTALRIGVLISTVGMLCCVIGLQATTGALLSRLLTQTYGVGRTSGAVINASTVQPIDIFVIQAAANALLSLLLALVISLWLLTQYKASAVAQA
mmetsp:Transcript_14985/g.40191  ORF Transcript_14985/g.40191 Transcript_14985/m.40191 type:complete len:271 (-) Transcript_14985:312-1124(-)